MAQSHSAFLLGTWRGFPQKKWSFAPERVCKARLKEPGKLRMHRLSVRKPARKVVGLQTRELVRKSAAPLKIHMEHICRHASKSFASPGISFFRFLELQESPFRPLPGLPFKCQASLSGKGRHLLGFASRRSPVEKESESFSGLISFLPTRCTQTRLRIEGGKPKPNL